MPVTVILERHKPRAHPNIESAPSARHLWNTSCPYETGGDHTHVTVSSFDRAFHFKRKIYPSSSSFVRSAIEAWARHSHLVLRPDDIWFQILLQINLSMLSDEVDSSEVFAPWYLIRDMELSDNDQQTIISQCEEEMRRYARAAWLPDWVNPAFSTSRPEDRIAAMTLMLGFVRDLCAPPVHGACGIPSITLLGTQQDWNSLLEKTDRLRYFGASRYYQRLLPLLARIVRTFDDPSSSETIDFWDQLVHAKVKHDGSCNKPPLRYTISGWILGFFFFDSGHKNEIIARLDRRSEVQGAAVDGIHYGEEHLENLPFGYGVLPIKTPQRGRQSIDGACNGWLVAGSIGKSIATGGPQGYFGHVAPPASESEAHPGRSSEVNLKADVVETNPNRLSRVLRSLRCFGSKSGGQEVGNEKDTSSSVQEDHLWTSHPAAVADIRKVEGHSTIQPCSGWAVMGPRPTPVTHCRPLEVDDSTAEAIESCDGIERYGSGVPMKYLSQPERVNGQWTFLPSVNEILTARDRF